MKKILSLLSALCLFTSVGFAQNLVTKVPANASLVIKYSGTSLSQKLPDGKFDSYASLKNKIFKELKLSSNTTLESIGIDLQQDAYQYLTTTDTTTYFVSIAAIKDAAKFTKFIQTKKADSIAIESKAGYQFYPVSAKLYLGWNGQFVTLVTSTYSPQIDYSNYAATDTTVTIDSTKMSVVVDSTTAASNPDSVVVDTIAIAKQAALQAKLDKEKQLQDDSVQKGLATDVLFYIYNANDRSIEGNVSFGQLVDKSADISVWVDANGIFNRLYPAASSYNLNNWLGTQQGINVYFETNKIRVEQKVLSGKDSASKLFNQVLDSKQNPSLVNYIHHSDIGYLSMSINTEAMLNYYYVVLKKIMSANGTGFKIDSVLADTYVDILQIIIDEKAIADMFPGNSVFVLHGLKTKLVKYTSYDYDKNYNSIAKQKTKTELSPDFCVVFDTKNEKIFDKLIDLPIKLNKDHNYDYTKTGDFYTLKLGADEFVDKLYFMVKNGKCIISTSLKDVDVPTYDQSTTLDTATQASI
jgi:hypothetical protein